MMVRSVIVGAVLGLLALGPVVAPEKAEAATGCTATLRYIWPDAEYVKLSGVSKYSGAVTTVTFSMFGATTRIIYAPWMTNCTKVTWVRQIVPGTIVSDESTSTVTCVASTWFTYPTHRAYNC